MPKPTEEIYLVRLETCGPLHVGSGETAKKTEYVYNAHKKQIEMLNLRAFSELLFREGLSDKYTDFILSGHKSLYEFILENGLIGKYQPAIRYTMDGKNFQVTEKNKPTGRPRRRGQKNPQEKNIQLAIKDPYHQPYIPGSSLKGALIQNLLYATALKHPGQFAGLLGPAQQVMAKKTGKIAPGLQDKLVRQLCADKKKANPLLAGDDISTVVDLGHIIQVTDSRSLSRSSLQLAEKLDLVITSKGEKASTPNVYREAIKEDTEIEFRLKLTRPDVVSGEDLLEAIQQTFNALHRIYRNKGHLSRQRGPHLYLGGGTGFISKTLHYSLFANQKEATDYAAAVLETTDYAAAVSADKPWKIKRYEDKKVGLAPKTIKLARTDQAKKEMGLCKISLEEMPR